MNVLSVEAQTPAEFANAFARMTRENVGGVIVALDGFFNQQRGQIAELAANNRLPSITPSREYPEAGGLMSYGQNLAENFRRAAAYVDKILKGAKPSDLPVGQATKIDLVINLRAARAIGLTVPRDLLIRADEVIR